MLPRHQTLAIRYYSLKPLAYCLKDGPTFAYANHAGLLVWQEISLQLKQFLTTPLPSNKITELLSWAKSLGVSWVVLPHTSLPTDYQPPEGSFRTESLCHFGGILNIIPQEGTNLQILKDYLSRLITFPVSGQYKRIIRLSQIDPIFATFWKSFQSYL